MNEDEIDLMEYRKRKDSSNNSGFSENSLNFDLDN